MVALWVSLGVQPCALAATSESDCPHCPPTHEQAAIGAHQHHASVDVSQPASGMASDCCEADEGTLDARQGQLEIKPVGGAIAGPPTSLLSIPRLASLERNGVTAPSERRPSAIPLRVLYCVYRN